MSFGIRMLGGGVACLVHSLFPFLFVRTASRCIEQLHDRLVIRRAAASRASKLDK